MYDLTYLEMEENWKKIISFGPCPFGSPQVVARGEYIKQEMSLLYPSTRAVHFTADGFNAEQWRLALDNTEMECYLMLGSGASKGFAGKLRFAGLHRVWDMYTWHRYCVVGRDDEIAAYITVRKDDEGIPQTIAEENTPLPHFIVGQNAEDTLRSAVESGAVINGYAKTSISKGAEGMNVVVPAHEARQRLILSSHYDTVYSSPGAYDNSAGAAVLMEVARRLKMRRLLKGLEIIFMDGEEFMLQGSRYLARTESDGVEMMLNIDGVGRDNLLEVWSGPEAFEREIRRCINKNPEISRSLYTTPPPPGSDHAPYYALGIPSCMLTFNDQGILHSPMDVYNKDILNNMSVMVRLVLGFLENFAVLKPEL